MDNLDKAKELLIKNNYTCVLCKDDEIFCSRECGIKPLVYFYETKNIFHGFSAADKTVGAGDGQCPIERSVDGSCDSKEAFKRIKETISQLEQK